MGPKGKPEINGVVKGLLLKGFLKQPLERAGNALPLPVRQVQAMCPIGLCLIAGWRSQAKSARCPAATYSLKGAGSDTGK